MVDIFALMRSILHRGAVKVVKQRVKATISDYDLTLVLIAQRKNTSTNAIPTELEETGVTFLMKFLSANFHHLALLVLR
jgi:hypothetical protein